MHLNGSVYTDQQTCTYLNWFNTNAPFALRNFTFCLIVSILQYDETENIAVGTYQFIRQNKLSKVPRIVMCNTHYRLSKNWAHNQSYQFDAAQETSKFKWLKVTSYKR